MKFSASIISLFALAVASMGAFVAATDEADIANNLRGGRMLGIKW